MSRFCACAFGAVALIHSFASWISPTHPLPIGVEIGAAAALALLVTWKHPGERREPLDPPPGP